MESIDEVRNAGVDSFFDDISVQIIEREQSVANFEGATA